MAKPFTIVLFGATGDLAVQKIFPALAALQGKEELSDCRKIVAVSRRDWGDKDLRDFISEGRKGGYPSHFLSTISYSKVDVEAGTGYEALAKAIVGEPLVYLSLAPKHHSSAVAGLREAGILAKGAGKVLVEKPFGTDEPSAKALNKALSFLKEEQVYRVDHYLGKATVRAMLSLQKTVPDLVQIVSSEHVSSMRIRFHEADGLNGRGASYDGVGAFRDVGQNHMLEMLAALAADTPDQEGRAKALSRIMPAFNTCALSRRGQYEGYLSEEGVDPRSETETAFEVALAFSSGRLKGVPVSMEGGKKMPSSDVFLQIAFKNGEGLPLFMDFNIRPKDEIVIVWPGGKKDVFSVADGRDAYENVVASAVAGDRSMFVGKEEIESLWRYSDQVVACWGEVPLQSYDNKHPF